MGGERERAQNNFPTRDHQNIFTFNPYLNIIDIHLDTMQIYELSYGDINKNILLLLFLFLMNLFILIYIFNTEGQLNVKHYGRQIKNTQLPGSVHPRLPNARVRETRAKKCRTVAGCTNR